MSDAVKRVFFGKGSDSLQVEGQDDLLVYRARCCNPIRGEEIIGYVTRGKGVAVHARSCPNVQNLLYESDRRIQVEWAPLPSRRRKPRHTQAADIPRQAHGALRRPRRPAQGVHRHHLAMTDAQHGVEGGSRTGLAAVKIVVETVDVRHLNKMVQNLRKVPGVRDVQRSQKI